MFSRILVLVLASVNGEGGAGTIPEELNKAGRTFHHRHHRRHPHPHRHHHHHDHHRHHHHHNHHRHDHNHHLIQVHQC